LRAKTTAIKSVLKDPKIEEQPNVIARAQLDWMKVEQLRQEYADFLDDACREIGETDPDLEAAIAEDLVLFDKLEFVDMELARLMFYKISPEKPSHVQPVDTSTSGHLLTWVC
jgi:hypothetical protein